MVVPCRNACEIKLLHQENAGLNVEMTKLAISKGLWSYVCKMDNALRRYRATSHRSLEPILSTVTFINKVPAVTIEHHIKMYEDKTIEHRKNDMILSTPKPLVINKFPLWSFVCFYSLYC